MNIRRNADVLREMLPLKGLRILDVGCGDGALARLMTREGARVTGIDTNPVQIATARAAEPAGDERYVRAEGERLPFPDGAFDAVVIFNALHHIPGAFLEAALAEVACALKPGGRACIVEPLAEGPHFELARPVDDETQVRADAYRAMRAAIARGLFREDREETYVNPVPVESFEAFIERLIRIDPSRKDAVTRHEGELRERFARLGRDTPKGRVFDQPMRINLLTRP